MWRLRLLLKAHPEASRRRPARTARRASIAGCAIRGMLAVICLQQTGCRPPDTPYPASIQSIRPTERIHGVKEAARRNDRDAIPLLVDRLEDDDDAVRMYAILALEKLTGSRMGYEYYAPEPQRWRAVQAWKRHLREETPSTAPADQGAGW